MKHFVCIYSGLDDCDGQTEREHRWHADVDC